MTPGALTSLAQMGIVLGAAGKGGAIGELFKAMQGAELRGALSNSKGEIDLGRFQDFLRNVEVTTTMTGGRVGPNEILQVLKSGGMGAAMLSDQALFAEAITPILSMGASRAGTGLQAFAMQFAAGKESDAAVHMLDEMGLIRGGLMAAMGRGDAAKVGIGQWRLTPNVLPESQEMRQHPEIWIQKTLLPLIDAYDRRHYGAPRDATDQMDQRMATGMALASRIPGGTLIGDVLRNQLLIQRDLAARLAAAQRDPYATREATDPQVQFKAFSAAMNALQISLGGPIMDATIKGVHLITDVLNTLSDWAKAHPETAGDIMKIAASLGLMSLAVAGASASFFFAGPMMKTLQWLASSQAAAAAGNLTAVGGAISSIAGIAAAAAITLGVSSALRSGLDAAGRAAEDAIYGKDNPDVLRARAQRQAIDNFGFFDMFDRSKWADPNAHWWNMSPKMPSQSQPIQLQGNVNLDGRRVGSIIANDIANQVSRAPSGQTGFDLRMTPSPTGATP